MNKQVALDPIQNVLATGVAIADLSKLLGTVLEKITLTLGGTFTKSMITLIQLKANGKIIWETTGSRLDASNLYNGFTADATILKLDFMDRKAVTLNARQIGAIDLSNGSGITQLRLEITIAGATTPTLVGFADVSPATNDPTESRIRWTMARRHAAVFVAGAANTFALPVPHLDPAGGGSVYRRIYLYASLITAFKTVRDGIAEHELTKLQNEASQKDNFKVPQSGLVVFDPVQTGTVQGNAWDTRKTIKNDKGVDVPNCGGAQMYVTFSGGETCTIETEELLGLADY